MNFIELLKWSWQDAKDPSHSCINEYDKEKGYKQWNILIPKSEWLEKKSFETLDKIYGLGLAKILVDLLIPSYNGHTNQLDLIFINRTGIYVIEVKNFTCNLEGNNTDDWVRKEFNGQRNKIHNPVKQNLSHIKSLQKLLHHYPSEYFKNIILISDECKFKYDNNTDLEYETRVINYSDLKATVRDLTKNSEEVFSDENIYRIYNELSEYARYSDEDRKRHLEYVQNIKGGVN